MANDKPQTIDDCRSLKPWGYHISLKYLNFVIPKENKSEILYNTFFTMILFYITDSRYL